MTTIKNALDILPSPKVGSGASNGSGAALGKLRAQKNKIEETK
jgi:hypothetical protein